jgi:hypothetical protein
MAWSTGSQIFEEIAAVIRSNVTDYEARCDVYRELIPIFEAHDAELYDVYGSIDEAFDEVWSQMYPEDDGDGW